jgi:protein TonB
MTDPNATIMDISARREVARWLLCGLIVVSVHGGAALALFTNRDRGELGDSTPTIVEFAALPVATAPPEEVAPGREQVQSEAAPLINQKMPDVIRELDVVTETKPVRMAEVKPVEPLPNAQQTPASDVKPAEHDAKPPVPDAVQVPDLIPVLEAEVSIDTVTPPPPPLPTETVEEDEKPEEVKTAVPVAPSAAVAMTTAPTSASVNSASLVSWRSRIATHLQRHKRYPGDAHARHEQGTARVNFTVSRSGRIVAASVTKGSGSSALDTESLAMLRRAEPLPVPPADIAGQEFSFSLPVKFRISSVSRQH